MKNQKRIRDYGIEIGEMVPGKLNSITDVPGVKVGHCTIDDGDVQTGVTAILPAEDIYAQKVMAASSVFNGFGKSVGLMQIDELGTIETPILLTNTLSVGGATQGLVQLLVKDNVDEKGNVCTLNPVVLECNDSYLNDIGQCVVGEEHVKKALADMEVEFQEGNVGAGRGMSCYQLQGGIGTASRRIVIDKQTYHLGSLVLTNMGLTRELIVDHKPVGKTIAQKVSQDKEPDKGSIIVVIACDIPLSERQLKRVANRAISGISRTGSYLAHGSGELSVAFSTHNRVRNDKMSGPSFSNFSMLFEPDMDLLFRATIESVEEAILNSMITAKKIIGVKGRSRQTLGEFSYLL